MYLALYRKYRPSKFSEVIGQKIVVKTLTNAISNHRINHAYLFCGPRGTGKTSIAKIFAKTINCLNLNDMEPCDECDSCLQINNNRTIDIIEIDAASNNGVDEIRELKNNVNLVPSTGRYKVYIIDEVHMLTTSAFNALLKTLEEPPKHVIFILATTEVHKIPQTVLSRCQRFDFKKISKEQINNHLKDICSKENISIDDQSLMKISEISNGGMRDALSLLDQINAFSDSNITEADVDEINGNIMHEQMFDIVLKMSHGQYIELLNSFKQLDSNGKNLSVILDSIIDYLKDLLIYVNDSNFFKDNNIQEEFEQILSNIDEDSIYLIINQLLETVKNIKYDTNKLLPVELCFIKLNSLMNDKKKDKYVENPIKMAVDSKVSDNTQKFKNVISIDTINKINSQIEELKRIRVNNTLSLFNKKDMVLFKNNLNKIKEMMTNSKYSNYASLVLDGELKAKGQDYVLFVYKTSSMENMFNTNVNEIEDMFEQIYNHRYKVIAESTNNWDNIKKNFNQALKENRKIYHFIPEKEIKVDKIDTIIEENVESVKTPIDNMFEDIVQYN